MGRELTWSNPEIIRLAREKFIPVAGDDWYQRRREDEEGEFFRKVANQGPRKGEGGATRQGIYVFTASGKLLAFRNSVDPKAMVRELGTALSRWRELPEKVRRPKAVKIAKLESVDDRFDRSPPKNALILNVFTRILDRADNGTYQPGTSKFPGGDKAARDHLWILESEWKRLVPKDAKVGQQIPLPPRLLYRLCRFHLMDNTRGEPPLWEVKEIRDAKITLTVAKLDGKDVILRLNGKVALATDKDMKKAKRGFEVDLLGYLNFNQENQKFTRFDVVAVGDHWGGGPFTRNPRPGKAPLGVAISLSSGTSAADQVPPQGARSMQGYVQAEKK